MSTDHDPLKSICQVCGHYFDCSADKKDVALCHVFWHDPSIKKKIKEMCKELLNETD